jgi:hypothetical protein
LASNLSGPGGVVSSSSAAVGLGSITTPAAVLGSSTSSVLPHQVLTNELRVKIQRIIDEFLVESAADAENNTNYPSNPNSNSELIAKYLAKIDDLKLTNEQTSELIYLLIVSTLSKSATDRHNASKLFIQLNQLGVFTNGGGRTNTDLFMNGLKTVLLNLSTLERECPCVKSNVSLFAARGTCDQLIAFADLAALMRHGAYYPLFFLCMQNMHKLIGSGGGHEWLRAQLEKSKVNLVDMLPPGDDRSKERLVQILEDRELAFVMPMLRVEAVLFEKIAAPDMSAELLRELIEANVEASVRSSTDFIQSLVTW